MKKYLFLSTLESSEWGGSEQLWSDMAQKLVEKGHKVMTNTLAWPEINKKLLEMERKGCKLTFRPNPHIPNSISETIHNKLQALKWKTDVLAFAPDVIYISQGGTFDNITLQHGAWLRSLEKPYYILCQFMREFDYQDAERRHFFRDFFGGASKVIFVSNRNRQVAERVLAADIDNAIVIRNPIKLNKTTAGYPGTDVYRIAVVARLEIDIKGYDTVLSVFAGPQWKYRNYQLNIYGSGIHEAYIKELSMYYELQDHVSFFGHVDDVTALWEQNHILLLASRGEGTPLSLLEANYCKRTAVVTDVGGNADIITEGYNGFVAEGPAVRCVADAMERAWQHREDWQRLGKAAKENIDQLYSTDPIAEAVEMIL